MHAAGQPLTDLDGSGLAVGALGDCMGALGDSMLVANILMFRFGLSVPAHDCNANEDGQQFLPQLVAAKPGCGRRTPK